MNKYELALVVNAKLEEEERAAVVEKAKGYVTRYGGTVGEVEEWGKKRLAYEIHKVPSAFYSQSQLLPFPVHLPEDRSPFPIVLQPLPQYFLFPPWKILLPYLPQEILPQHYLLFHRHTRNPQSEIP